MASEARNVNPVVLACACYTYRFLAISPPEARFKIGVVGDTKAQAVQRYLEAFARWEALLESDKDEHTTSDPTLTDSAQNKEKRIQTDRNA